MWTTVGIVSVSGVCCRSCDSTKKKEVPHQIIERSVLTVENGGPPHHLYLLVQVATILDSDAQQQFMEGLDFPFQLEFHGATYTLFSRGFWNGSHYWCKLLRNIGGISGVWMHDDRENRGIARLISPDHTTIAGRARHTSWLFYSRRWKPNEEEFVVESIKKITQDNNGAPGSVPFTHLATLLNLSPNQPPPLIGDTPGSTVGKIVNEQPSALTVAQSAGALTAPINAESSSSAAEKPSNFKRNLSGEFKIRLKVMKRSKGNQNSGTQPNIEGQQNYNNIPKNDDLTLIGKGSESSSNPIDSMKVKKTRKKAILVPKQTGTRTSARKSSQK
ncbi:hypothetical protein PGTUg99_050250 [Puccinia graminis f. sp. tritici]|uniref:Uncharacterized protein n=1 Tax=Puccinia graminis f. sp. tritici TaxID=56615 RepID=A0A5B0PC45_PUCGR|nr:hypothetical protein PGTUg99_050250 [Puccinia graminis f. sp. tritici]